MIPTDPRGYRPGQADVRFVSIFVGDQPAVAVVDAALREFRPLAGIEEIGVATPLPRLLEAAARPGPALGLDAVKLRPVVPNPRRVICLGLNYLAHVEETGRDRPAYPVLFTKWASSLIAHGDKVIIPPETSAADYEAELAVIIGRAGRRISKEDALGHLAGVTIANDVTIRDYQYKTHQWLQGKAWDATTPLGPALVTLDELGDPGGLEVALDLNGQEMQRSNTRRLIFDIPTIIATISEFTTLECGDVILTGTPAGVGYRREPPVRLTPGDRMVVRIEGLGCLSNSVITEDLP